MRSAFLLTLCLACTTRSTHSYEAGKVSFDLQSTYNSAQPNLPVGVKLGGNVLGWSAPVGNFSSSQGLDGGSIDYAAIPVDLNNDGIDDLIVANSNSDGVSIPSVYAFYSNVQTSLKTPPAPAPFQVFYSDGGLGWEPQQWQCNPSLTATGVCNPHFPQANIRTYLQSVYVASGGTAANVGIEYGTGSNCGSNTVVVVQPTPGPISVNLNNYPVPAGSDVCCTTSGSTSFACTLTGTYGL